MKNYKASKSASKASVAKVKVIDRAKVDEVKYKDGDDIPDGKKVGDVKIEAVTEQSHEELEVSFKMFDSSTGEAADDSKRKITIASCESEVAQIKSEIVTMQSKQADWEELVKDLKAL